MDDDGPTASIILCILIIINAIFYGFSAAINSLSVKDIEKKTGEVDEKKTKRLQKIIGNPIKYNNTVQLITALLNVIIGVFYMNGLHHTVNQVIRYLWEKKIGLTHVSLEIIGTISMVAITIVILYILLTIGILLPQKIATRMSQKWVYACVNIIYYITLLLSPFIHMVVKTAHVILHIFGAKGGAYENDVTEEEIISMVNEGHEQGIIEASEAEMISNIIELGDKEAQDIMTHRINIVGIDCEMQLKDCIDFMLAGRYSRYPVYKDNIDHIIGILHLKDVLRFYYNQNKDGAIKDFDGLLREPYYVPQTKNLNELFKDMQSQKILMVIVVDEYGQIDGLLAMEDILEEIVGNILDEYDEETDYIKVKGKDEYIIEGKTPLEDLEERFDIEFDDEEFDTLNGFLISKMDRIPEENEEFEIDVDGYHFKILSVESKRIQSVLVTHSKLEEINN